MTQQNTNSNASKLLDTTPHDILIDNVDTKIAKHEKNKSTTKLERNMKKPPKIIITFHPPNLHMIMK